ncbi:hypothetical protein BPOR_0535g00030 [Botrytis porri]|uniref:Uncharacterized protein n=1 Tax=Botrytis porri TaxID=87229 RepID=A0A4Z1KDI0_9HELO|nr:hypothetical protein BPOR_0535g00030 [Botrytis porri]
MYCTCQGHFNHTLASLGGVFYGIETLNTLVKGKKELCHNSFSKNEGVNFASQYFEEEVRTRDSSPPVYSFENQIVTSGVPAKLRTESYKRSDPPEK